MISFSSRRHCFPPVFEEVFVEHLFGGVVVVQHAPTEGGALFGLLSQPEHLAIIPEPDLLWQRLIGNTEIWALVLQEPPLYALRQLAVLLPQLPNLLFLLQLFLHRTSSG